MEDNKKTKNIKELSKDVSLPDNKIVEAQHRTIISLSKQIENLKEEVTHLKKLLEESSTIINLDPSGLNSQVVIAETQLQRLKDISIQRHLTLEEAKKVEIYTKILSNGKNPEKDQPADPLDNMSTEDLMKMFMSNNDSTRN